MRVALLTYSTRPRGGVVHTLNLAEALARLGVDVHVWTLARGGDATFFRPVDPAVTVHAVPFPDLGDAVGPRILRSIATLRAAFAVERGAYDVVHAQDCISANAALPCLRTVHHLDTFTTPELAACHERAVVEPSALVCVSASVAGEVASGWGREAAVIPNGVDAARFAAGAADTAARAGWAARLGDYVLALGGIEPRKGTLDLVHAWARLREARAARGEPVPALVIGGGETLFDYRDYRAQVDDACARLGVEPIVLGTVDDDALPSLVAQARALAFVSTQEGFGLAALEALAAGVPVVGRDLPVLREVFGTALAYGSDAEGIALALDAVLTWPPDPAPGLALAAAHTWESAARAHLDVYDALI
ncbi:MAG: MSMEG_0565 family glycosyltransferase [Kineosporiaceae bacterium]